MPPCTGVMEGSDTVSVRRKFFPSFFDNSKMSVPLSVSHQFPERVPVFRSHTTLKTGPDRLKSGTGMGDRTQRDS